MNFKIEKDFRNEFDRLIFLIHNIRRVKLNEIGLYKGQPIMLNLIENNPGLSQKEYASFAEISTPTVNVMLNRLSKNDLVRIEYDDKNPKITKVYLTEKGKESNKKAKEKLEEIEKIQFKNLSEKEISDFENILRKMNNNLEKEFKEVENENKND